MPITTVRHAPLKCGNPAGEGPEAVPLPVPKSTSPAVTQPPSSGRTDLSVVFVRLLREGQVQQGSSGLDLNRYEFPTSRPLGFLHDRSPSNRLPRSDPDDPLDVGDGSSKTASIEQTISEHGLWFPPETAMLPGPLRIKPYTIPLRRRERLRQGPVSLNKIHH